MKLLLIAYYFPPLENIATHRLYSFARYFADQGDEVTVLCPEWNGNLNVSISGIKIISTGSKVFDPSYGASQPKKSYLDFFKRFVSEKIFHRSHFAGSRPSAFFRDYEYLINDKKIIPQDYDIAISSYSPLDSHFIAADLKKRNPSIKWIADFRDLYSLLEYQSYGWSRQVLKYRERQLIGRADLLTTVSCVLARQLNDLHKKRVEVIYNGFNAYRFLPDPAFKEFLKNFSLPIISYAGSLYHGERDVLPFLKYFKERELDKQFVLFFSLLDSIDEDYLLSHVKKLQLSNVVIKRNLPYADSQELLQCSYAVMLFANFNFRGNGFLTGKVFEYIQARKPVLYSGTDVSGYELYDLIRKHNMGDSFTRFNWHSPDTEYTFLHCEEFSREAQARKLYQLVKEL